MKDYWEESSLPTVNLQLRLSTLKQEIYPSDLSWCPGDWTSYTISWMRMKILSYTDLLKPSLSVWVSYIQSFSKQANLQSSTNNALSKRKLPNWKGGEKVSIGRQTPEIQSVWLSTSKCVLTCSDLNTGSWETAKKCSCGGGWVVGVEGKDK